MTEKFYKISHSRLERLVYRDNLLNYMESAGVYSWAGMRGFSLTDVQEDFEYDMEKHYKNNS